MLILSSYFAPSYRMNEVTGAPIRLPYQFLGLIELDKKSGNALTSLKLQMIIGNGSGLVMSRGLLMVVGAHKDALQHIGPTA